MLNDEIKKNQLKKISIQHWLTCQTHDSNHKTGITL